MKNPILQLIAISWRLRRHFVALCATQLITNYFALNTSAQAPQGIPYQAIARNASGVAIANTAVKVRFSIRDSIATGAIKYQETHNPTTSALGLFSVNVGMGTVISGTFSGINWGKNAKFLQVELDPAGGINYTDLGTTQMMSVPYALYAGVSSSSTSGVKAVNPNNYNSALINGVQTNAYLPNYIYDCGDGAEGDLLVAGTFDASVNNTIAFHKYRNLTIPIGTSFQILDPQYNPNQQTTMIILVKDTLRINGTIDGKGRDGTNVTSATYGSTLKSRIGSGGGGATNYSGSGIGWGSELTWQRQSFPNLNPPDYYNYVSGGSPSTPLNSTSNGQSVNPNMLLSGLPVRPELGGCEGAGSGFGSGGKGGNGLYLICKVLIFNGNINLSGGKGAGSSGYFSGGGGGGSVIISAEEFLQNSGTFNLSGGSDSQNTGFRKGGDGAFLIIDR
jgi:hypothetical protein